MMSQGEADKYLSQQHEENTKRNNALEELANVKKKQIEQMVEGQKLDTGKLPWELLPWDGVAEIVKVLQFGANKYAARNWEKGINYSRIFGAIIRHVTAWFMGETNDPETGLNHLAHAGCEVLFALTYSVRGMKHFDDRPEVETYGLQPGGEAETSDT